MDCYWPEEYENTMEGDLSTFYPNKYDSSILYYFFGGMRSHHLTAYEDRRFKFKRCKPKNVIGYENYIKSPSWAIGENTDYDSYYRRGCESDGAINGVISYHNDNYEDRTFLWDCTKLNNNSFKIDNCFWTGYLVDYEKLIFYSCPNDGIINAIQSRHSNSHQDRQFSFNCCNVYYSGDIIFSNITGEWIEEWSCIGEGCSHEVSTEVGIETSHTESISSSFSISLTSSISAGFKFLGIDNEVSVSSTIAKSQTSTISNTLTMTSTETKTTSCDGNRFYQWIMKSYVGHGYHDQNQYEIIIKTEKYVCQDGIGLTPPKCPINYCADHNCQSCLAPFDQL